MLTLALQYPFEKALAVSAIGLSTVIIILAIIACLILLVSKAIRTLEAAFAKKAPAGNTETSPAAPTAESVSQGQVDLVNTDEKEAAVIMAIVSDKSGIPLERLSFKSIKLLDEKKKGEK